MMSATGTRAYDPHQPGGVNSSHQDDESPLPHGTIVVTVADVVWILLLPGRTSEGALIYQAYGHGPRSIGELTFIHHRGIVRAILPNGRNYHWTV